LLISAEACLCNTSIL